jgi:N utilization substance protein B
MDTLEIPDAQPEQPPRQPTRQHPRRQGREFALQVLYQVDLTGTEPHQALALFWQNFEPGTKGREFTTDLVEGSWRERERLDTLIADAAENWRLGRLPKVDVNLLRLSTYELLTYPDLSAGVTINEAIEIARRYCSDEAPTFINGVLDRIATVVGKKTEKQAEKKTQQIEQVKKAQHHEPTESSD